MDRKRRLSSAEISLDSVKKRFADIPDGHDCTTNGESTEDDEEFSFTTMAGDILIKIFQFNDSLTRAKLKRVCRRWSDLLRNTASLLKHLKLDLRVLVDAEILTRLPSRRTIQNLVELKFCEFLRQAYHAEVRCLHFYEKDTRKDEALSMSIRLCSWRYPEIRRPSALLLECMRFSWAELCGLTVYPTMPCILDSVDRLSLADCRVGMVSDIIDNQPSFFRRDGARSQRTIFVDWLNIEGLTSAKDLWDLQVPEWRKQKIVLKAKEKLKWQQLCQCLYPSGARDLGDQLLRRKLVDKAVDWSNGGSECCEFVKLAVLKYAQEDEMLSEEDESDDGESESEDNSDDESDQDEEDDDSD